MGMKGMKVPCMPESLGKRGVEHPRKVRKESGSFLDILLRAML